MSLEVFRAILNLERSTGHADRAVMGGLDKYLAECASLIRQRSGKGDEPAWFRRLCLSDVNYKLKGMEERQRWIADALRMLDGNVEKAMVSSSRHRGQPKSTRKSVPSHIRHASGDGLDSPVTVVKGVAPKVAAKLGKLGIFTVRDMLYFFPKRHMDYSKVTRIAELLSGEEQTVLGVVWEARANIFGHRRSTEAVVGDDTGNVRVVWFNQPYLAKTFPTNARIVISGKVAAFRNQLVFESPEWEFVSSEELTHAGRLVPVYALTQGIGGRQMRRLTRQVLDNWSNQLLEFLPSSVIRNCKLMDRSQAVMQAHYPEDQVMKDKARERLAFDELFLLQIGVLTRKKDWQESQRAPALSVRPESLDTLRQALPFILTSAQERVLGEITADISGTRPMCRLLQGEVGSGKTIIAAAAVLIAVSNGYQAALMAPTGILAEQHFRNLTNLLGPLIDSSGSSQPAEGNVEASTPGQISLLVGSQPQRYRRELRRGVASGNVKVVVGTHALLEESVEFRSLGLAVVDEQHRFGVLQRSALRQKGSNPHLLVMTATPIPRTLALTLYGDLELSIIDELPPGRQAIKTRYLGAADRPRAYEFIRKQVQAGRQAFVICPLVEESELLDTRAAVSEYEKLSGDVFSEFDLSLLHGRMSAEEKETVMRQFRDGETDILVSTSVVEVGIDIPNATVMLVEGADRFGLSQLHQFRGRVGRGSEQSYCILLSDNVSPEAKERLSIMERTGNGFVLAEEDLKLRGPGEFFGVRQSGLPDLRMARLSDVTLLETARREAELLFASDSSLTSPNSRLLVKELARVWDTGKEAS